MGTSLSGLTPATTFDGLLKTSDNDGLTTTKKTIGTGDGINSQLKIATNSTQIGNIEFVSSNVIGTVSPSTNLRIVSGGIAVNGDYSNPTANTRLHIKGSGATSATTSLLVQNSAGSELLKVTDDGVIDFGLAGLEMVSVLNGGTLRSVSNREINITQTTTEYSTFFSHIFETWDGSAYSEAMRITGNTDQFVGIGETTPTARLHVKGSGTDANTIALRVQNSAGTDTLIIGDDGFFKVRGGAGVSNLIRTNTTNNNVGIGLATPDSASRMHIQGKGATSATTALLVQNSAGTELFDITDNGEVEVKSGDFRIPSYKSIYGGGSSTYAITLQGTTAMNFKSWAKDFAFNTQNGTIATLKNDGKFGLGETAPSAQLQVKGSGNDATTTALLVQNSDGDDMLKVLDNGQISASGDRLTIGDGANVTLRILASGNAAAGNNYIQPLGTPANQRVVVTGNSVATIKAVDLDASNVYIGHGINQTAATGTLSIKGSGATSATTALLVQNSAGVERLKVRDDGWVDLPGTLNGGAIRANTLQVDSINFKVDGTNNYFQSQFTNNVFGSVNTDGDASALVTMKSTTQGFLPPRMTTTERDAISTPAAGLMVYNTTTNKAQCYNGTAWQDLF